MKEWEGSLGINAHSWFTVFRLGEIAKLFVMNNFGPDATCTVYCAPSLVKALNMGIHVSGNLITIPSEAQRNKWG